VKPVSGSVWNALLFLLAVAGATGGILLVGRAIRFHSPVQHALVVLKKSEGEALADPEGGEMKLGRPDGSSIRFGSKLPVVPSWIPDYPISSAQDVFQMDDGRGNGSVSFTLPEPAAAVCRKLDSEWRRSGLLIESMPRVGHEGCMVVAARKRPQRTAVVSIGIAGNGSTVNVTYTKQ
jgi:hypothetical protein